MRSSVVFTVLALAASVSSISVGHSPDRLARRRHGEVQDSVLQARAARRRGANARRCAAKTSSSALPSSTAAPALNVGADPTTSSSKAEPTSSLIKTTSSAEPTKSTVKAAATKTTSSVKETETPSSSGGSGSGDTHTGQATFYGTGLGACGITNKDTDYICAVSMLLFDGFEGYTGGDPNQNPICGRKLTATYKGKSVSVTVTDRCVGCAMYDLDFAPSAFDQLASQDLGRLSGMTWTWN